MFSDTLELLSDKARPRLGTDGVYDDAGISARFDEPRRPAPIPDGGGNRLRGRTGVPKVAGDSDDRQFAVHADPAAQWTLLWKVAVGQTFRDNDGAFFVVFKSAPRGYGDTQYREDIGVAGNVMSLLVDRARCSSIRRPSPH